MTDYGLPYVLEEIAQIAGIDAAREVARAKGGTRAWIPLAQNLSDDHWLIRAVGPEAAVKICRHFQTNKGAELDIPLGPFGGYLEQQRARARAMRQALDAGATIDDAARIVGLDRSSVKRFRRRMRNQTDHAQKQLF